MKYHGYVKAAVLVYFVFAGSWAWASTHVALVIGNHRYTDNGIWAPLDNPGNDAKLISEKLRGLGYDVGPGPLRNLTEQRFRAELDAFAAKARNAEVAVIYFAGHGAGLRQDNGRFGNYLIPIDKFGMDTRKAIDINDLEAAVAGASELGFLLIDACRSTVNSPDVSAFAESADMRSAAVSMNNARGPESDRAGVPLNPRKGAETFRFYAASYGKPAVDGVGNAANSPFAQAISSALTETQLPLADLVRSVTKSVRTMTNDQQEPASNRVISSSDLTLFPERGPTGTAVGSLDDVMYRRPDIEPPEGADVVRACFAAARHASQNGGSLYQYAIQPHVAIPACQRARDVEPENVEIATSLAIALDTAGRSDEAVTLLEELEGSGNPATLAYLASLLGETGLRRRVIGAESWRIGDCSIAMALPTFFEAVGPSKTMKAHAGC